MTLEQIFHDERRFYWPIEAYVHARAYFAKQHLIRGEWSVGFTWHCVGHCGPIQRPRLPQ